MRVAQGSAEDRTCSCTSPRRYALPKVDKSHRDIKLHLHGWIKAKDRTEVPIASYAPKRYLRKCKLTDFLEDVVIVPGLYFLLLGFVGVAVHWIADEEEVEVVLEFDVDKMLQFGVKVIVAHPHNHHQFPLFVLWV